MSDEHVAVHGDDDRLPRSSDLRVWVPPDDWIDHDWPEWVRIVGGRVIVLRRSRGYSEMVEWEGEVWLEVEK